MKIINLTRGYTTQVDDEDFEKLQKFSWRVHQSHGKNYAINTDDQLLHRCIVNAGTASVIDHIDGDGLNNTKGNLRVCTNQENVRFQKLAKHNTSGYKGVRQHVCGKFEANIKVNNVVVYLGLFDTAVEAAKAYDEKARESFGNFAKTNRTLGLLS